MSKPRKAPAAAPAAPPVAAAPPPAPTPPAPPPFEPGVYQDANRYNCLAFRCVDGSVYYVANEGAGYEVHVQSTDTFAARWCVHLPGYPVRRCARVYMNCYSSKTPNALRVLKHFLRDA